MASESVALRATTAMLAIVTVASAQAVWLSSGQQKVIARGNTQLQVLRANEWVLLLAASSNGRSGHIFGCARVENLGHLGMGDLEQRQMYSIGDPRFVAIVHAACTEVPMLRRLSWVIEIELFDKALPFSMAEFHALPHFGRYSDDRLIANQKGYGQGRLGLDVLRGCVIPVADLPLRVQRFIDAVDLAASRGPPPDPPALAGRWAWVPYADGLLHRAALAAAAVIPATPGLPLQPTVPALASAGGMEVQRAEAAPQPGAAVAEAAAAAAAAAEASAAAAAAAETAGTEEATALAARCAADRAGAAVVLALIDDAAAVVEAQANVAAAAAAASAALAASLAASEVEAFAHAAVHHVEAAVVLALIDETTAVVEAQANVAADAAAASAALATGAWARGPPSFRSASPSEAPAARAQATAGGIVNAPGANNCFINVCVRVISPDLY
jgi:hypothetical protein